MKTKIMSAMQEECSMSKIIEECLSAVFFFTEKYLLGEATFRKMFKSVFCL